MKTGPQWILLSAIAACSPSHAEEVWLQGDDHVSGRISTMTQDGVLALQSPLSSQTLQLRSAAVKKIVFAEATVASSWDTHIELRNGDTMMCELKAIDATHITATSPVLSELRIPRALVRAIHFGVAPIQSMFQSADMRNGWTNTRGWSVANDMLEGHGPGLIWRTLALPEPFVVRCKIQSREPINLRVYFAETMGQENSAHAERYSIHLHPNGIDVKRQSARRFTPLHSSNKAVVRRDGGCELELRFNRASAMFQLFINGELEGTFSDPVSPPLPCKQIGFETFGGDNDVQVSNIELRTWDNSNERFRTTERGNDQLDAMIDSQGQRWIGRLDHLTPLDQNTHKLSFTTEQAKEALAPNSRQVATLFFAKGEDTPPPAPTVWKLTLSDGSTLHTTTCEASEQRINFEHPAFGPQSVPRHGVLSAERIAPPAP